MTQMKADEKSGGPVAKSETTGQKAKQPKKPRNAPRNPCNQCHPWLNLLPSRERLQKICVYRCLSVAIIVFNLLFLIRIRKTGGFAKLTSPNLAKPPAFCTGAISQVLAGKRLAELVRCKKGKVLPRKTRLYAGGNSAKPLPGKFGA